MQICIKYIPKDLLLYELWRHADKIPELEFVKCNLTLKKARRDLKYMIINNRKLHLTTYYGKALFIDISSDYLDPFAYDMYNADGLAQKVIAVLKIQQLEKIILRVSVMY